MRQIDCDFIFTLFPTTTKRNLISISQKAYRTKAKNIGVLKPIGRLSGRECNSIFTSFHLHTKREIICMIAEVVSVIHWFRMRLNPFESLPSNAKKKLLYSLKSFPGLFKTEFICQVSASILTNTMCDQLWNDLQDNAKSAIKRILEDVFIEISKDKDWYIVLLVARSRYMNV